MIKTKERQLVVIRAGGFLTSINPKDKQSTDTVLYEGTPDECEAVIHGGKKNN
jgi:hypothetical protein